MATFNGTAEQAFYAGVAPWLWAYALLLMPFAWALQARLARGAASLLLGVLALVTLTLAAMGRRTPNAGALFLLLGVAGAASLAWLLAMLARAALRWLATPSPARRGRSRAR